MNRNILIPVAVVVAAGLGIGGWRVFEYFDQRGVIAQAAVPCPPPPAGGPLPLQLPASQGVVLRQVATQGATTAVFADVPGGRTDVVAVRDRVLTDLKGAGYRVVSTDQEQNIEAEAGLAGPHEGTIKVKPLCQGTLELRYAMQVP